MIKRLHQLPISVLSALLFQPGSNKNKPTEDIQRGLMQAIDWESLAAEVDGHVIGVILYQRLCELNLCGVLPTAIRQRWIADSLHAELQHALQHRASLEISRALTGLGIRHALIKGAAYRLWLYRPPWVRISGDIDILIDRTNIEAVRLVMHDLGFIQAACSDDAEHFRPATWEEITSNEASHYELVLFVRDHRLVNAPDWLFGPDFVRRIPFAYEMVVNSPVFHVCVDVHWALHFAFADASPLNHLISIHTQAGAEVPVLESAWNVFTSCFKLYFEAFDRPGFGFHHLIDIVALLEEGAVDWRLFQEIVAHNRIEAAAFYVLSAAQRLAGRKCTPPDLLDGWRALQRIESTASTQSNDLGDFISHMFGVRMSTAW